MVKLIPFGFEGTNMSFIVKRLSQVAVLKSKQQLGNSAIRFRYLELMLTFSYLALQIYNKQ